MIATVINYGAGNLGSLICALEILGATVKLANEPSDIKDNAGRIFLPGVGAFPSAMEVLTRKGWHTELKKLTEQKQIPLLGICLGMQLLGESSNEFGGAAGLGIIPGHIKAMVEKSCRLPVPHIGWNQVKFRQCNLLNNIPQFTDFYFVHSYIYDLNADSNYVFGITDHDIIFPSVVGKDNVWGVQFHPEKSAKAGKELLANFLKI